MTDDVDALVAEYVWMTDGGIPAATAIRKLGYPSAATLSRLLYRHHIPVPASLVAESVWERNGRVAS